MDKSSESVAKIRQIMSLVAGILIGITLLVSGSGKVLLSEGVPAQVVDFVTYIIPDILITPATIFFINNILVPYIFPWAELLLGCFLLIGFVPRLAAVLCLPMLIAFMGTNIWSIVQGGYATCASCFGIWEKIFGSLTPVQSLVYDVVLLALAIVVIVLYPGTFLSSRKWLVNVVGKAKPICVASLRKLVNTLLVDGKNLKLFFKQRRSLAIGGVVAVIGIIFIAYGVTSLYSGTGTTGESKEGAIPPFVNLSVSQISEKSAVISWTTDKPTISRILLYDENGTSFRELTDKTPVTSHSITLGDLTSNAKYYFEIVVTISDKLEQILSRKHYFITLAGDISPPVISNVRVSEIKESSIIITWTTSKPATSEVEYWLEGSSEQTTVSKDALNTNHRVELTELVPDATYRFRVKSTDATGDQVISDVERTFSLATGAEIGKRAPDFTLTSLDGNSIMLSNYRGKLVMLDFWIWTCTGCREKMTIIQEAFNKMSQETTTILCIHVEGRTSVINNYAISEKLTVPILLDLEGTVAELYKVTGFPTTFFIDGDGFIRAIDKEFSNAEELMDIFNTLPVNTPKPESVIPGTQEIAAICCLSAKKQS